MQLSMNIADYELAAEFFNTCRSNGVQGSNTDFLICAAAANRNYSIFTTDKDFENFQAHIHMGASHFFARHCVRVACTKRSRNEVE